MHLIFLKRKRRKKDNHIIKYGRKKMTKKVRVKPYYKKVKGRKTKVRVRGHLKKKK